MDKPGVLDDMPGIRRAEMARAAEILGVSHRWLGYVDSGLPEGDPPRRCPRAASRSATSTSRPGAWSR